jgi:hypothetical protein
VLRFEWNALRTGDRVLVHDRASTDLALSPGVVTTTDAHRGAHGANGVGIRVAGGPIVRPSHMAVHRDPRDVAEPCWRCDTALAPA